MQSSRTLTSFDFRKRGRFMIKVYNQRKAGTFSGLWTIERYIKQDINLGFNFSD